MALTRAEHKAKAEHLLENVKTQSQILAELVLNKPNREDVNTALASIESVVSVAQAHIAAAAITDWDTIDVDTVDVMTKQRKAIRAVLTDRWSLDQEEGWDEFGSDTLDDIMEVFYGQP